jgi:ferric-dicitrate binding protein FerR (iron transport regulator)
MHKIASVACMVFMAVAARAQTEVATVTSSAPFTLRGAGLIPGQGVPTWPVLAGDNIKAGSAMTIVTYPDGSVITLAPGSEARVDLVNGKPTFQLLSGTARYSLKSTTAVQVLVSNQPVALASGSGTLTMGGAQAAAGFWTAGHVAAVVIVAGATAAGVGVAVADATGGGAAVSPSR